MKAIRYIFVISALSCATYASIAWPTQASTSCGFVPGDGWSTQCLLIEDTTEKFHMRVLGSGDPSLDHVGAVFEHNGNWRGQLVFSWNSDRDDEEIWFSSHMKHLIPPHGEGEGLLWDFDNASRDGMTWKDPVFRIPFDGTYSTLPHKSHLDRFKLIGIVKTGATDFFGNTSISSWQVDLYANHVPEPGVWSMFITGFGIIGAALRRQQNSVASAR